MASHQSATPAATPSCLTPSGFEKETELLQEHAAPDNKWNMPIKANLEFAQFDGSYNLKSRAKDIETLDVTCPKVVCEVERAVSDYNQIIQKDHPHKVIKVDQVYLVQYLTTTSVCYYYMTFKARDHAGNTSIWQATRFVSSDGCGEGLLEFYLVNGYSDIEEEIKDQGFGKEAKSLEEHTMPHNKLDKFIRAFAQFAKFDGSSFILSEVPTCVLPLDVNHSFTITHANAAVRDYNQILKKENPFKVVVVDEVYMAEFIAITRACFHYMTFKAHDQAGNTSICQATKFISYCGGGEGLVEFYLVNGYSDAMDEEMKDPVFRKLHRDLVKSIRPLVFPEVIKKVTSVQTTVSQYQPVLEVEFLDEEEEQVDKDN